MSGNLENSAVATGLEMFSFHSSLKECSNYHTISLISHASKVMLKFFQAELQQYVNQKLTEVQDRFRKRKRNKRWNYQHLWIIEKQENWIQKNVCFIVYAKALDCVDHNKLWKIPRDGNTRLPYLLPKKPLCRSRSNSKNWTWNNGLVPNWLRSKSSLVYCHPTCLTYMQRISCKMPGWVLPGEILTTSDIQTIPL